MDKKGGMAIMIGMGGPSKGGKCPECGGMGCSECEGGELYFDAPEGMDYSDLKKGDEKEVLAKVKYYGDGKFELISVDGYSLSKENEEAEVDESEMEESPEEGGSEEEDSYAKKLSARAGLM